MAPLEKQNKQAFSFLFVIHILFTEHEICMLFPPYDLYGE